MEPDKHSNSPATDASAPMADVAAQSPFFRLPRELRDEIYDMIALDATSLYYEFSLKAGATVQKTALLTSDVSSGCPPIKGEHPHSTILFPTWQTISEDTGCESGLARICKQLTVEYSAAVERRIECLLSFGCEEPRLAEFIWMGQRWVRLEYSTQKRADNSVAAQSSHALTIPVLVVSGFESLPKLHAVAYFTFRFHDSEDLGQREHQFISSEREGAFVRFELPKHVLQQLNDLMNAADWKSSVNGLKERMLWFQYFKRHAVKQREREATSA